MYWLFQQRVINIISTEILEELINNYMEQFNLLQHCKNKKGKVTFPNIFFSA